MTSIRAQGDIALGPGFRNRSSTAGGANASGVTPFSATNNLIGQQITPTNSAMTDWAQGRAQNAGNAYGNFQFSPFQGVGQMNFGPMQGMLTGANSQMQGLGFNFGNANTQYGNAQSTLANAAQQGTQTLQGLQGLGVGSFSGGGANLADFGRAEGMLSSALSGDIGKNFEYAGDTMGARAFVLPALERAMTAPDRNALAAESLALMEERSRRGFDDTMRSTAEQQAALGRRGSGMTAKALNDVTNRREQELAWARRDLANEASSRTMQDNMDRTTLAMGTTAGLGSEDRERMKVRQAAAALGLEGAGMLSNNAQFNASQGEAASQRAARGAQFGADFQRGLGRDIYQMGLDQSRLGMDIGDRFGDQERDRVGLGERQANFTRGIGNDLAGFEQQRWRSAFDERNAGRDDEFNRGNFEGNRFRDFFSALGQQRGEDRANRGELRDERRYQYGLSQDAIDNDYRRMDWEENLRGNRFNRGLATANIGFGARSPAGAYGAMGANFGNQSAQGYDAMGQLLAMLGNRSNRRGGSGRGGGGGTPVIDVPRNA